MSSIKATTGRLIASDAAWLTGMSTVMLLSLLPFSSYIASLPFIRAEWDLTNAQSGIVFSIYLVGYALSSLWLLPKTDSLGVRRVLLTGMTIMVVSNLLFPLVATNFWSGAALRFAAGVGHVAVYIPTIRLVSQRFDGARRGMAVGLFVAAGYAGTTLSYITMGFLLDQSGTWQRAYFLTALAGVSAVGLAWFLTRDANDGGIAASADRSRGGRLDLTVLRDRPSALMIAGYALHTAELYLARLWFPLLLGATLANDGMPSGDAAIQAAKMTGLMFMTGIVGVFVGGYFSDRVGRTRGAAAIFSVSGACSFVIGWLVGVEPAVLIALGFVYGLSTAADSAVYSTGIIELSPPDRIGSTQAVQSFIGFTVGAFVPVIAGVILDASPESMRWGLAFSFSGLLAVAGVWVLLWLRRLPEATRMAAGKR